jgi:hypothetical protein
MGVMRRVGIQWPDDIGHHYSLLRAWDRHLLNVGLLPIATSDSNKVGPILVNPDGDREYIVYGYDECGRLTSWRQVLSKGGVWKASDST